MGKPFYLRICGVGGQGSVHLAGTLAAAAVREGISVSVIDRPRSAMRLGPITCDLCLGQEGFAPFIVPGEADAVLGQEPLDGVLNAAYYLKKGGTLVLQSEATPSIGEAVACGIDERRTAWKEKMLRWGCQVVEADASAITGTGRNYYMLGVFLRACPWFPISAAAVEEELAGQAKNLQCLREGMRAAV